MNDRKIWSTRSDPPVPVSNRELASASFEPWMPEENGEILPSARMIGDITVTCRLAHAIMLKSRDELTALHMDASGYEAVDDLITSLVNTGERLKEMASMVEGAYCRVIASMAAAYEQLKADHHAA